MTESNKQKLMKTRGGVIPKPQPRRRGGGGGSFPWPTEERRKKDRTKWFRSVRELFRGETQ